MTDNAAPTTNNDSRSIADKLAAFFSADEVRFKPQALTRDRTRAMAVAYIDARAVMQRLDDVVGPFGWSVVHRTENGRLITGLGLRDPQTGEFVWKWDVGMTDSNAAGDPDKAAPDSSREVKGSMSDGLKRAAVLWGIGRYLYHIPRQWCAWDNDKRQFTERPTLPTWAAQTRARATPAASAPAAPQTEKERAAEAAAESAAEKWDRFVTSEHPRQGDVVTALGGPRVSVWLKSNPTKDIDAAIDAVRSVMRAMRE